MFVATIRSVDTKSGLVKGTFQTIRFGNVSKGTVFNFTPFAVTTEGHFTEIVLVQEFARRTLHAQIPEPVATHHGAEAGIVFGTRQEAAAGFGSICCNIIIIVWIETIVVVFWIVVVIVV